MMEWDRTTLLAPNFIVRTLPASILAGPEIGWSAEITLGPSAISPDNTTLPPSCRKRQSVRTAWSSCFYCRWLGPDLHSGGAPDYVAPVAVAAQVCRDDRPLFKTDGQQHTALSPKDAPTIDNQKH